MSFDDRYQDGRNGPLTQSFRNRIAQFRSIFTLAEIGDAIGFSGPFVSQILNETRPARVDSKHIERIVRAVEEAEATHAKTLGLSDKAKETPISTTASSGGQKTLDYHLTAIDALGWKITGLERKG